MDEYLKLTGVSHIVMCKEGTEVLQKLSSDMRGVRESDNSEKVPYEKMVNIKAAIDNAYDKIIEVAKNDLQSDSSI